MKCLSAYYENHKYMKTTVKVQTGQDRTDQQSATGYQSKYKDQELHRTPYFACLHSVTEKNIKKTYGPAHM